MPGRAASASGCKTTGDPRGREIDVGRLDRVVPFNETRLYTQRVLESLQIYRGQDTANTTAFSLAADLAR